MEQYNYNDNPKEKGLSNHKEITAFGFHFWFLDCSNALDILIFVGLKRGPKT